MQDSSPFQYIAIDQLSESKTNPWQTFDQARLEELATSIKHHGLIQPIVVRPKEKGFEVVAGARRFRACLLAEEFSVPAHIKELNDAEAVGGNLSRTRSGWTSIRTRRRKASNVCWMYPAMT